jgi:hypothetical protein
MSTQAQSVGEPLRHDTKDLFIDMLFPYMSSKTKQVLTLTPCLVQIDSEWRMVRHPALLLELPDEVKVLCPWPGQWRQDVFEFTVGDFRKALTEDSGIQ